MNNKNLIFLLVTVVTCSFFTPKANAMKPGSSNVGKKPIKATPKVPSREGREKEGREKPYEISPEHELELVTYFLSDPSKIKTLEKEYAELEKSREEESRLNAEMNARIEGMPGEEAGMEIERLQPGINEKTAIIEKLEKAIAEKLEKDVAEKLKALKIEPDYVFKKIEVWKGCSPIHIAACNTKSDDLLKILIKIGADINKKKEVSLETPLHFACKRSLKNVETLLNAKEINKKAPALDLNAQTKNKNTPLHNLASTKDQRMTPADVQTAMSLLMYKADVNIKDKDGKTVLELIKDRPGFEIMQANLASLSKSQLKPTEKPIETFENGMLFNNTKQIFVPSKISNKKFELIECYACNEKFAQNDKVIQLPCGHIFHEDCIAQWLLTKDNIRQAYNTTCPACREKLTEDYIEKYLLALISKNLKNEEFKAKFKQMLLFNAATKGYENILLKMLFTADINVNVNEKSTEENHEGWTPLHFAAQKSQSSPDPNFEGDTPEEDIQKRLKVIKLLVYNGADPNAQTQNSATKAYDGQKPIDLITNTNSEAYEYLEKAARTKAMLFDAAKNGKLEILEKLITGNIIDVNLTDKDGNTPLHLAAIFYDKDKHNQEKSLKIIKLILEKGGAKITTKNNYDNKPIDHIKNKNSDGYKYLADKTEEYLLELITKQKSNEALMKTILFDAAKNGYLKVLGKLITNKIIDVNTTYEKGDTTLHLAVRYSNDNPEKGLEVIKLLVEKGNAEINLSSLLRETSTSVNAKVVDYLFKSTFKL